MVNRVAQDFAFSHISLSAQFRLIVAAVVTLATAAVGLWLGHAQERQVITQTAQRSAIYVEPLVKLGLGDWSGEGALPTAAAQALDRAFADDAMRGKVAAFKLWDRAGRVVYSVRAGPVERLCAERGQLAAALAGHVQSCIDLTPHTDEPGAAAARHLGIYVPVHHGPQVLAVAEFDRPMDDLDREIWIAKWRGWAITVFTGLLIYALIYSRIRLASETIEGQRRELEDNLQRLQATLDDNRGMREQLAQAAARTTALNEQFLVRIAADLHDGPAQKLAYVLLRFDELAVDCAGCCVVGTQGPRPKLVQMQTTLGDTMNDLRTIASALPVPGLADTTLAQVAQRALCDASRHGRAPPRAEVDDTLGPAPLALKITLYRVLQESLANCRRYAPDATPEVIVRRDAGELLLEVKDHGSGFDPAHALASGRLGLLFMRERVRLAGGIFELDAAPGRGTTVRARIPLLPA